MLHSAPFLTLLTPDVWKSWAPQGVLVSWGDVSGRKSCSSSLLSSLISQTSWAQTHPPHVWCQLEFWSFFLFFLVLFCFAFFFLWWIVWYWADDWLADYRCRRAKTSAVVCRKAFTLKENDGMMSAGWKRGPVHIDTCECIGLCFCLEINKCTEHLKDANNYVPNSRSKKEPNRNWVN